MLFKDINQQANEILEDTSKNGEVLIEKKKGKFDALKSAASNTLKTGSNATKNLVDAGFDALMKDGKNSSEERKKFDKANKDKNLKSYLKLHGKSALDAIAGNEGKDNKPKSDEQTSIDGKSDEEREGEKSEKQDEKITLTSKDQVRLEKNIFSQDDKTKRTIFKSLLASYNDLGNSPSLPKDKKVKTESFDYLSIDRKLLSDQELIKILDYIYGAQRRNKENVKESTPPTRTCLAFPAKRAFIPYSSALNPEVYPVVIVVLNP